MMSKENPLNSSDLKDKTKIIYLYWHKNHQAIGSKKERDNQMF